MTFRYPDFLWLFLILPVLGTILLLAVFRTRAAVASLVGPYIRDDVLNLLTLKSFIVTVLFSAALSALIFALAGPQWGEESVEDERRGLELVFLVDISNSMLVTDVLPSRIGRAREVARTVASRLPDIYHSIVVFKGSTSVLVPMTDDSASFELAMRYVSPSLITTPGTDLGVALMAAIDVFPAGSPRHRAIILVSDGGHGQGVNSRALERVRDAEIPVFSIIAGTPGGGTIPTADGGVLRDATGDPVIVGVDDSRMRHIAQVTGGASYLLTDNTITQQLVSDLEQLGGWGASVLFRQVSVPRYHLFVLAAFFLLTIMILVRNIRWRGLI